MDCNRVSKLVVEYCDNELQPALSRQIDHHLNHCSACRALVDFTNLESQVLRDIKDVPEVSYDFCNRVVTSIKANSSRRLSFFNRQPHYNRLALLATGTIALLALTWLYILPQIGVDLPINFGQSPQIKLSDKGKEPTNQVSNSVDGGVTEIQAKNSSPAQHIKAGIIHSTTSKEDNSQPDSSSYNNNQLRVAASSRGGLSVKEGATSEDKVQPPTVALPQQEAIKMMKAPINPINQLLPSNIPLDFEQSIEEDSEDSLTILYRCNNEDWYRLSIKLNNSSTDKTVPATSVSTDNNFEQYNSIEPWQTEVDGKVYLINLIGNLSQEELQEIASSIPGYTDSSGNNH
ncbi:MAG: zf-HC2 domain-containing protein [Chitinophagales bacterium]